MSSSLGELFRLLREGHVVEAVSLFSANADEVHSERFKRVVSSMGKAVYVGEYIVIGLDRLFGVAVIGVDENGRFFVHFLLPNVLSVNDNISAMDVRRAMGFDVHLWEVKRLEDGLSIRLQGDIVVRVIKVFDSLDSLLRALWDAVVDLVANTFVEDITPELEGVLGVLGISSEIRVLLNRYLMGHPHDLSLGLRKFVDEELLPGLVETIEALYRASLRISRDKTVFRLLLKNKAILRELYGLGLSLFSIVVLLHETIKKIHVSLYRIASNLASELNESALEAYLDKALETIANQERRIRFLLGRHTIEVTGITFRQLGGLRSLVLSLRIQNMRSTVIIMREQDITARHPQHGVARLRVDKPCIIEIGTLDSARMARTGFGLQVFLRALFNALGLMDNFQPRLAQTADEVRFIGSQSQVGLYVETLGKNWAKISRIVDYVVSTVMGKASFRYRLARVFYHAVIQKVTSELRLKVASILVPKLSSGKQISKRKTRKIFR